MKYVLQYGGEAYSLADEEGSRHLVETIRAGKYPGLVTVEANREIRTFNLSESVEFALFGNEFPSGEKTRRKAVVI